MQRAIEVFEKRYGAFARQESTEQCRDCPPSVMVRPRVRQPMMGIGIPVGPPQIEQVVVGSGPPAPQRRSQPSQQPLPSPPTQVVIAPCQDDLRRLVAEYMAKNPPPAGRDGERGPAGQNGRDAEVNYAAIIEAVVSQLPPPKQGPPGPSGPAGPQGLVGVPDNEDIRNWLIGAMSNQETRNQLSVLLSDLVSSDPRVDALIQRLEALEAAPSASSPPGDLQAIVSRLQALEGSKNKVTIVVTDNGKEIFNRSGVPDGSTVRVPITRVER